MHDRVKKGREGEGVGGGGGRGGVKIMVNTYTARPVCCRQ